MSEQMNTLIAAGFVGIFVFLFWSMLSLDAAISSLENEIDDLKRKLEIK